MPDILDIGLGSFVLTGLVGSSSASLESVFFDDCSLQGVSAVRELYSVLRWKLGCDLYLGLCEVKVKVRQSVALTD